MALGDDKTRSDILNKMAQSRAEIRRLLEPPPAEPVGNGLYDDGSVVSRSGSQFPRSRTMRMLVSGRGIGAVGAIVGGVLLARPALALRLLRMVPAGAVAKALAIRALTSMRDKQSRRRD